MIRFTALQRPLVGTSRICAFRLYATQSPAQAAKLDTTVEHKSRFHGSYHWDFERALSFTTVPLLGCAAYMGSHPMVDLALGVVIPLHCHIGVGVIIDDYVPKRRNPGLNTALTWGMRGATLLVLYGCYEFNTNDVGLTALAKRIWTGKL